MNIRQNIEKLTFGDEDEEQSQKIRKTHQLLNQLESKLTSYIRPSVSQQSEINESEKTIYSNQLRMSTQQPVNYSFKDPDNDQYYKIHQGQEIQQSFENYIQEQLEQDAQILYKEQKERLDLIMQKSQELVSQELSKREQLKSQCNKIALEKLQLLDNIRRVKQEIYFNTKQKDEIQIEINILLQLNEELIQNNIKRTTQNMNSTPIKSNKSLTQPHQSQISQVRVTQNSQPEQPEVFQQEKQVKSTQNFQPEQLEVFSNQKRVANQNKDQSNQNSKETLIQKSNNLEQSESLQDFNLRALHNRFLSQFSNIRLQDNSVGSKQNIQIVDDSEENVEKNLFFQKSQKQLEKGRQLSGLLNQSNTFQTKSANKTDIQNDEQQDEESKSKSQLIYRQASRKSIAKKLTPNTQKSKSLLRKEEGSNLDFDNLLKQRYEQENIITEQKEQTTQKSFQRNKENSLVKRNRQTSLSVSGKNFHRQKVQVEKKKTKNLGQQNRKIQVADDFREIYEQHFRDKIQYLNQLVADTLNME